MSEPATSLEVPYNSGGISRPTLFGGSTRASIMRSTRTTLWSFDINHTQASNEGGVGGFALPTQETQNYQPEQRGADHRDLGSRDGRRGRNALSVPGSTIPMRPASGFLDSGHQRSQRIQLGRRALHGKQQHQQGFRAAEYPYNDARETRDQSGFPRAPDGHFQPDQQQLQRQLHLQPPESDSAAFRCAPTTASRHLARRLPADRAVAFRRAFRLRRFWPRAAAPASLR